MVVEFSSHNIRLDNGTYTKPDAKFSIENHPWLISAKRIIETVFPGDKQNLRLADIGCLEGGYAVEFARMGLDVLGVEIRDSNIAACNYVKLNTNLPNLNFVKDNALIATQKRYLGSTSPQWGFIEPLMKHNLENVLQAFW